MAPRSRGADIASQIASASVAPMPSMPVRSSQAARARARTPSQPRRPAACADGRGDPPSAAATRSRGSASSAARWARAAGTAASTVAANASQSAVMTREIAAGDLAQMADAETEEHAGERCVRAASIAAKRLAADVSPQPSSAATVRGRARCRASSVKMSAGARTQPRSWNRSTSVRPARRCRTPRARRDASAGRRAAPGRSGRRCSGARSRPVRAARGCRSRGRCRGRRRARALGAGRQVDVAHLGDHVAGAVDLDPVAGAQVGAARGSGRPSPSRPAM